MSDNDIFINILIALGSIILTVLFARWVFAVKTRVAHAKAQTILLAKIAVASGVPKEEVQATLNVLDREL